MRITFGAYAKEYLEWAKLHHRGWRTEQSRVGAMANVFADIKLDTITTADVGHHPVGRRRLDDGREHDQDPGGAGPHAPGTSFKATILRAGQVLELVGKAP